KPAFLDNMDIRESPFGMEFGSTMAIAAPNHPLAAGRNGRVEVTDDQTQLVFGRPLPSATVVATAPGESFLVTIFALERGAATPSGPTPARRAAWLAQESTVNALNANGWAMFE